MSVARVESYLFTYDWLLSHRHQMLVLARAERTWVENVLEQPDVAIRGWERPGQGRQMLRSRRARSRVCLAGNPRLYLHLSIAVVEFVSGSTLENCFILLGKNTRV